MLNATDAWKRAFTKSNPDIVYLVRITINPLGSEGNGIYTFVSGQKSVLNCPPSVLDVNSFSGTLDPVTRIYTQSERIITFLDDGSIRQIISNGNYLHHKKITVKLGSSTLTDEADFLLQYVGLIKDIVPTENNTALQITCVDATYFLNWPENKVKYFHHIMRGIDPNEPRGIGRKHPLEVISHGLDVLNIPASLYDNATLDVTLDLTRSHYVVTRHNDQLLPYGLTTDFNLDKPISEHINEMLFHLYGSFIPQEDGIHRYKQYNALDAPVAHWSNDVLVDVTQPANFKDLYNKIQFGFPILEGEAYQVVGATDDQSVINNTFPGDTGTTVFRKDSEYLNGFGTITAILSSTDTNVDILEAGAVNQKIVVNYALHNGFCGSLVNDYANWYGHGSNSIRGLSSTRKAYLALINRLTGFVEIVAATAISPSTTLDTVNAPTEAAAIAFTELRIQKHIRFAITERGLFNTTSAIWRYYAYATRVVDITLAVNTYNILLTRFANGCSELQVVTLPIEADKQVGDFISLDYPKGILSDRVGIDSNVIWEIINKTENFSENPTIKWKLKFVRTVPVYTPTITYDPPVMRVIYTTTADILKERSTQEDIYLKSNSEPVYSRSGG